MRGEVARAVKAQDRGGNGSIDGQPQHLHHAWWGRAIATEARNHCMRSVSSTSRSHKLSQRLMAFFWRPLRTA